MLYKCKRISNDSLSYSYLINNDTLAIRYRFDYVCPRHNYVPCTYVRICAQSGSDPQLEHTLYTSSIYTHILLRHIHVITMSYLKCCYVLMGHYVSAFKFIKMKKEKLDISPFLYIFLMIVIFAMSL